MDSAMTIPAEIRERIIEAATRLYEEGHRDAFPTVNDVRRAARVDMNAASAVMKDWRRAQTVQATPVAISVPESVQQAGATALAVVWTHAQELANDSLRAAQAAWEVERGELEGMRQELAEAFEAQEGELNAASATADDLRAQLAEIQSALSNAQATEQEWRIAATEARAEVEKQAARVQEIENNVTDLRRELQHAHAEVEGARVEVSAAIRQADDAGRELLSSRAKAEAQNDQFGRERAQLENLLAQAQSAREAAREQSIRAKETAANLQGQLDATQAQNAALLVAIKESNKDTAAKRGRSNPMKGSGE